MPTPPETPREPVEGLPLPESVPWAPNSILLYGALGVPLMVDGTRAYTLADWAMGAPPSLDTARPVHPTQAHHVMGHALALAWGAAVHTDILTVPRVEGMVNVFEVAKMLQDDARDSGDADEKRVLLEAAQRVLRKFSR